DAVLVPDAGEDEVARLPRLLGGDRHAQAGGGLVHGLPGDVGERHTCCDQLDPGDERRAGRSGRPRTRAPRLLYRLRHGANCLVRHGVMPALVLRPPRFAPPPAGPTTAVPARRDRPMATTARLFTNATLR